MQLSEAQIEQRRQAAKERWKKVGLAAGGVAAVGAAGFGVATPAQRKVLMNAGQHIRDVRGGVGQKGMKTNFPQIRRALERANAKGHERVFVVDRHWKIVNRADGTSHEVKFTIPNFPIGARTYHNHPGEVGVTRGRGSLRRNGNFYPSPQDIEASKTLNRINGEHRGSDFIIPGARMGFNDKARAVLTSHNSDRRLRIRSTGGKGDIVSAKTKTLGKLEKFFQESEHKRDAKGRFADQGGAGDEFDHLHRKNRSTSARVRPGDGSGAPSMTYSSVARIDNGPRRTKAGETQKIWTGRSPAKAEGNVKFFERRVAAHDVLIEGLTNATGSDDIEGQLKIKELKAKREGLAHQLSASQKALIEVEQSPRKFKHNIPKAVGEEGHMNLIRRSQALVNEGRAGAFEKARERKLLPKDEDGRLAGRAYRHAAAMAMEDVGLIQYDFGPMSDGEKKALKPYEPFMRYVKRRVWQDLNREMTGEFAPYKEEFGRPFFRNVRDKATGERRREQPLDPTTGQPRKTVKRNFEFIKADGLDEQDHDELRKAHGIATSILGAL